MSDPLLILQKKIGYTFNDSRLLTLALIENLDLVVTFDKKHRVRAQ